MTRPCFGASGSCRAPLRGPPGRISTQTFFFSRSGSVPNPGAKKVICQFDGMIAYVSPDGRECPHVLVVLGTYEARGGITDGKVLEGALPAAKLEAIRSWLAMHRAAMKWVKAVASCVTSPAS